MKWRARLACALALTILFLDTTVESVDAQVFIASNSRPEFWIAPLFVSANVTSEDVASRAGPVTMTVSWSVAPPPNRTPAEIAQDLYLLWPGEVPGTARSDGADPRLAREVEALGFKIKEHGVLRLLYSCALAVEPSGVNAMTTPVVKRRRDITVRPPVRRGE